jgi:hypothetical protein
MNPLSTQPLQSFGFTASAPELKTGTLDQQISNSEQQLALQEPQAGYL